jgi:hypothetical protein
MRPVISALGAWSNTSTAKLLVPPNSGWGLTPVAVDDEFFEGRNDQGLKKEQN